jgi:hypothetical protein
MRKSYQYWLCEDILCKNSQLKDFLIGKGFIYSRNRLLLDEKNKELCLISEEIIKNIDVNSFNPSDNNSYANKQENIVNNVKTENIVITFDEKGNKNLTPKNDEVFIDKKIASKYTSVFENSEDNLRKKVNLEEFKAEFIKSYNKSKFLFFIPPSKMMEKMNGGLIKDMDDVRNHISINPNGRSAQVLHKLENNKNSFDESFEESVLWKLTPPSSVLKLSALISGEQKVLIMETLAKIRFRFYVKKQPVKQICRELKLARNTVKKAIKEDKTEKVYRRTHQPAPKLEPYVDPLKAWLKADD